MSEWQPIETSDFPELGDYSVLIHFENGSIETVHVEDYFAPITAGMDIKGNQLYSYRCLNHSPGMTHWMPLPEPPEVSDE